MGKCSPQGKGYWQRPGAPSSAWLQQRRRAIALEMTQNRTPQNVVEAREPLEPSIMAILSKPHRDQIRSELSLLLQEALRGRNPLMSSAPKSCKVVCQSTQCGGSVHGATHHILCGTKLARAPAVKACEAHVKEYLPQLAAQCAQATAQATAQAGPSTQPTLPTQTTLEPSEAVADGASPPAAVPRSTPGGARTC